MDACRGMQGSGQDSGGGVEVEERDGVEKLDGVKISIEIRV